jgi:uncharacterized membrane protein YqiK
MFVLIMWNIIGFLTGLFLIWLFRSSVVNVGARQVVIPERRWFGKKIPQGRVYALSDEIGIQLRVLKPGLNFFPPFIYKFHRADLTVIGDSQVGLIRANDGTAIEPGKIFADITTGHNNFQDGEEFIKKGGQKGPQIDTLPPGPYRINPILFSIEIVNNIRVNRGEVAVIKSEDGLPISGRILASKVLDHNNFQDGAAFLSKGGQKGPQIDILLPATYRINTWLFKVEIILAILIPPDKIGMITALDGDPLPETEFVAKSIVGHNDFQDGEAFLSKGGQRGPQFDVIKPGTYYINPLLFKVELADVATVERGQVAVVVSNVGDEPEEIKKLVEETAKIENSGAESVENRLDVGLERYVVPKGCRGIQQEVAGPGIYYLNRRAFIPYIIDTTNITIDWDESQETKFDQLQVISKDGFPISVSVKVIIRVRPDQAPYMVAKIGSIENLTEHVIHPMIDSSFRNQASSTSAMNFMQDRQDEQKKAEDRARAELDKYHVECVSVLICQIVLPPELMATQTERVLAEQRRSMFQEQQKTEKERIETMRTKAEADKQPELMSSEIAVKVSAQNKLATIQNAEAEREKLKIEAEGKGIAIKLEQEGIASGIQSVGEAKGKAILAEGIATAEAYQKQNQALGGSGVVAIEVAKQISEGKVKVTPDFLINGSNGNEGLLSGVLMNLITGKTNFKEIVK